MAREDVSKDSQLYQNLGRVLEAFQRGQELVSRILTFSRRQHHELEVLIFALPSKMSVTPQSDHSIQRADSV